MKLQNEIFVEQKIKDTFGDDARVEIQRERRIKVYVEPKKVFPMIAFLKAQGFDHFVAISCVDWIKDDEFELVYHLWSHSYKVHVMVKTRIPRKDPVMETVSPIFEHAETYERDIHEFFGIDFPGNQNLRPFILEDWDGPPPMRKDFDTRRFSELFYGQKDIEKELFTKVPQKFRGGK